MPADSMLILGLIVFVFSGFGVCLAWADWYSSKPRRQAH